MLEESEYKLLSSLLGRTPTMLEEAITQGLWNEHCSYKSSKKLIEKFSSLKRRSIGGSDENAGGIVLSDGTAVVFKMESHNHPSYIEPFQGAATGVGGILRDIFAMGARPIGVWDVLFFGSPSFPKTPYLFTRVVEGIAWYGNCVGVPTVGGELWFDEGYNYNCLVNVMALGILEDGVKPLSSKAKGIGSLIVYVGQKTGPDGIFGSSMASKPFDNELDRMRPQVQIGDPFKEKLLIEATIRLFKDGLLDACQDCGASGLVSAVFEMAYKGKVGAKLDLDKIPLRTPNLEPWEILISESQERMIFLIKPADLKRVLNVCKLFELDAQVIGEITDTHTIDILFKKEIICSYPHIKILANSPISEKKNFVAPGINSSTELIVPVLINQDRFLEDLKNLTLFCWLGLKEVVYSQYDYEVGIRTIRPPLIGPCILRINHKTNKSIAVAVGAHPYWCVKDPRRAIQLLVGKLALELSCVGATPLGVTNCLNYGTPENPYVMNNLKQTVEGLIEVLSKINIDVVSGNVSLYNSTGEINIHPTPVIGMVGETISTPFREDMLTLAGVEDIVLISAAKSKLNGSVYGRLHPEIDGADMLAFDLSNHQNLMSFVRSIANHPGIVMIPVGRGGLFLTILKLFSVQSKNFKRNIGFEIDGVCAYDARAAFGESASQVLIFSNGVSMSLYQKKLDSLKLEYRKVGKLISKPSLAIDGDVLLGMNVLHGMYEEQIRSLVV